MKHFLWTKGSFSKGAEFEPQTLVAIALSRVMENFEGFSRHSAVVIGGVCFLMIAAMPLLAEEKDAEIVNA
ncbi:hypothetical protein N9Z85_04220 [Akkermansiaceae bacterium]|nr:hypothetical protein [Akkermansiaceae bacterium]